MHSRTPLARIWGLEASKTGIIRNQVLKMQSFNAVEPVTRGAPLTQQAVFRLHFHGQDDAMKHAALPLPWTKKEQPFPGFSWSVGGYLPQSKNHWDPLG